MPGWMPDEGRPADPRDDAPAPDAPAGPVDDTAIRDIVRRLARPHRGGGDVVERAAILAEGAKSDAILAWIEDHHGVPEAAGVHAAGRGLYGGLRGGDTAGRSKRPARYVLPAGAVSPRG